MAETGRTTTNTSVHPNKRFCATYQAGLKCPKCGEEDIYVRDHDKYYDGNDYESYCDSCDVAMVVYAQVEVTFTQPEASDVIDDAPEQGE